MANVPKKSIKAKLATLLKAKEDAIAIFGLKTKFGGGRSSGFALIYDSVDVRKKYDSKCNLRRVSSLSNPSKFNIIFNRMATSQNLNKEESKERKLREESRRSEVLLRQRLPLQVERRSELSCTAQIFAVIISANYLLHNYFLYIYINN